MIKILSLSPLTPTHASLIRSYARLTVAHQTPTVSDFDHFDTSDIDGCSAQARSLPVLLTKKEKAQNGSS